MAPHRVFLTGEPGCGKTTAVKKACEILRSHGKKLGGILSGEIRERGMRIGFTLEDIFTHETGILAHINQNEGPRVGKYRVNLEDIQRISAVAIRRAIVQADVIIVDELGPMELNSMPFILAVEMALASTNHFVGTIHKRASHHLVAAIRSNPSYQILEVTQQNRNEIPTTIAQKITSQT